jgi:chromosome segregation ATPase
MSAYEQLFACQSSLEETVSRRLGEGNKHATSDQPLLDTGRQRDDPLLHTLSADASLRAHVSKRAEELASEQQRFAHEVASQKREVSKLRHHVQSARDECRALRAQLCKAEEAQKSAQAKSASATCEADSRAAQLKLAQQKNADAVATAAAAERSNAQLRTRLADLERGMHAERAAMSKRATEVENALDGSHSQERDVKAQLKAALRTAKKQELDAFHAAETAAATVSDLRASLAQAQHELQLLRQATRDTSTSSELAEQQVAQLREANSKLKADLREAESLLRRADEDRCVFIRACIQTQNDLVQADGHNLLWPAPP